MSRNSMVHLYERKDRDVLYHYTSAKGALSIARNNSFWLSDYSKTNDPTEFTYAKERFIAALQSRRVWISDLPRILVRLSLSGMELNTTMLIGSLTREKNDLDQWRRYGDGTCGCVVGIDAHYLEEWAGVAIKEVQYSKKYIEKSVNVGLAMLEKHHQEKPEDVERLIELARFFVADLFAFKHPQFKSEREVRISRMLVIDENDNQKFADVGGHTMDGTKVGPLEVKERSGVYGTTKYVELPLMFSDGRSAVSSIGFGPNCPEDIKEQFQELKSTMMPPLKFWQSTLPFRV